MYRCIAFLLLYCYCYCYFVYWWIPFIPSRNIVDVFTYNHMTLMCLRSRSHVKASMVLTRANHFYIHNYIISLLNIILKYSLFVRIRIKIYIQCMLYIHKLLFYIYILYSQLPISRTRKGPGKVSVLSVVRLAIVGY